LTSRCDFLGGNTNNSVDGSSKDSTRWTKRSSFSTWTITATRKLQKSWASPKPTWQP